MALSQGTRAREERFWVEWHTSYTVCRDFGFHVPTNAGKMAIPSAQLQKRLRRLKQAMVRAMNQRQKEI